MRLTWCIGLAVLLGSLVGCQPSILDLALRGKLSLEESNEVVTEYCQSCHIHRTFTPSPHIPRMQGLYDRPPFTATTACRACHLVQKDTWQVKRRKKLWPAQAAAGHQYKGTNLPPPATLDTLQSPPNPSPTKDGTAQ